MKRYYPRKPVRSFQDLTVYQKTLGLGVEVVKRITSDCRARVEWKRSIINKLSTTVSEIPVLIAQAHSLRFGDSQKAIASLEKSLLYCNLAIVYLEQYRDLVNQKISADFFEEQIREYLRVRGKILRLQKSWLRFISLKEKEN